MKGWGPKSSVCPSKPGKPNFLGDVPGVPEKFAEKKFVFILGPLLKLLHGSWSKTTLYRIRPALRHMILRNDRRDDSCQSGQKKEHKDSFFRRTVLGSSRAPCYQRDLC